MRAFVALACCAVLTSCGGGSSPNANSVNTRSFTSFPVASGLEPPSPSAIAAGSNSNVWFAAQRHVFGEIGSVTTAGTIINFTLPQNLGLPGNIASSNDGSLWFATNGANPNSLGRVTIAGVFSSFQLPAGENAQAIAAGPDGAMWFTEISSSGAGAIKLGRITPTQTLKTYAVSTNANAANGIVTGPDGALWFTMYVSTPSSSTVSGDAIGRITAAGSFTQFPLPTTGGAPGKITAGPDGALWFTEENRAKIGRITTGGAISEYPVPTPVNYTGGAAATGITAGNDGAVWFVGNLGVGRIDTTGVVTRYAAPSNVGFGDIVLGPDGDFWMTDAAGAIWRFAP